MRTMNFIHYIFSFVIADIVSATIPYQNYSLVQLMPLDAKVLRESVDFDDPDSIILKHPMTPNDSMDVLVPESRLSSVENYAIEHKLQFKILYDDYSQKLQSELKSSAGRSDYADDVDFDVFKYQSGENIHDYLKELGEKYPNLVNLRSRKTVQKRPITSIEISKNPNNTNPIRMIDAGHHAREWISIAFGVYIINKLLEDANYKFMLDGVDWHIIPLVNPDGYEYSRKTNRLWRKNRSHDNITGCYGVDLNRNYGFEWGGSRTSTDPCNTERYLGKKSFSEKETQFVRNHMLRYKNRIKLYITLHSYGQYLVYPWAYTNATRPENWKELHSLAEKYNYKISVKGGPKFTVMNRGQWYPASGGSDDFAFGTASIPFAYTMELTKDHQFSFPEYQLSTTLPVYFEAFDVFYDHVFKL